MSGNKCNACNAEFMSESEQRAHYKSEWHRHNLKRKVAGVPGVSEALFNMRLEALEAEKKSQDARMIYTCGICSKSYSSSKAHAQHLKSKLHLSKAADLPESPAVVRPAPVRAPVEQQNEKRKASDVVEEEDGEESDEWEEVEGEADIESLTDEEVEEKQVKDEEADDEDDEVVGEWDVSRCFFCDAEPDGTLEGCVEHMHRMHGFFIPDAEFLKDPKGLLNYLGLKVTKGFMCLYCDEKGKRFQSLEAVRKHMIAKSHCKIRYGESEEEEDLEDFYDFSTSYEERGDLMAVDQEEDDSAVSLTPGGFELVLKSSGVNGPVTKTIGNREFQRYYKQRPRPVESEPRSSRNAAAVRAVVSRYWSMGLSTRQPNAFYRAKETRHLPSVKLEVMRSKLGLKNNVIRNLPKNCTH